MAFRFKRPASPSQRKETGAGVLRVTVQSSVPLGTSCCVVRSECHWEIGKGRSWNKVRGKDTKQGYRWGIPH